MCDPCPFDAFFVIDGCTGECIDPKKANRTCCLCFEKETSFQFDDFSCYIEEQNFGTSNVSSWHNAWFGDPWQTCFANGTLGRLCPTCNSGIFPKTDSRFGMYGGFANGSGNDAYENVLLAGFAGAPYCEDTVMDTYGFSKEGFNSINDADGDEWGMVARWHSADQYIKCTVTNEIHTDCEGDGGSSIDKRAALNLFHVDTVNRRCRNDFIVASANCTEMTSHSGVMNQTVCYHELGERHRMRLSVQEVTVYKVDKFVKAVNACCLYDQNADGEFDLNVTHIFYEPIPGGDVGLFAYNNGGDLLGKFGFQNATIRTCDFRCGKINFTAKDECDECHNTHSLDFNRKLDKNGTCCEPFQRDECGICFGPGRPCPDDDCLCKKEKFLIEDNWNCYGELDSFADSEKAMNLSDWMAIYPGDQWRTFGDGTVGPKTESPRGCFGGTPPGVADAYTPFLLIGNPTLRDVTVETRFIFMTSVAHDPPPDGDGISVVARFKDATSYYECFVTNERFKDCGSGLGECNGENDQRPEVILYRVDTFGNPSCNTTLGNGTVFTDYKVASEFCDPNAGCYDDLAGISYGLRLTVEDTRRGTAVCCIFDMDADGKFGGEGDIRLDFLDPYGLPGGKAGLGHYDNGNDLLSKPKLRFDNTTIRVCNRDASRNDTRTPCPWCEERDCAGKCEFEKGFPTPVDCLGVCNGTAVLDDCRVCNGNNEDKDCLGVCFGGAEFDCLEVCDGTAVVDCAGICNGETRRDCKGVCGGNATEICIDPGRPPTSPCEDVPCLDVNLAKSKERGSWDVGAKNAVLGGRNATVYYPAEVGSVTNVSMPCVFELLDYVPAEFLDDFAAANVSSLPIEADCHFDLPLDPDCPEFPLVVLVHTSGGTRFDQNSLATHLASRGFMVLALDHDVVGFTDIMFETVSFADELSMTGDIVSSWTTQIIGAIAELGSLFPSEDCDRIASNRQGIIGHGPGATVASYLANNTDLFKFAALEAQPLRAPIRNEDDVKGRLWTAGLVDDIRVPDFNGTVRYSFLNSPMNKRLVGLGPGFGHLTYNDRCRADFQFAFGVMDTVTGSVNPFLLSLLDECTFGGKTYTDFLVTHLTVVTSAVEENLRCSMVARLVADMIAGEESLGKVTVPVLDFDVDNTFCCDKCGVCGGDGCTCCRDEVEELKSCDKDLCKCEGKLCDCESDLCDCEDDLCDCDSLLNWTEDELCCCTETLGDCREDLEKCLRNETCPSLCEERDCSGNGECAPENGTCICEEGFTGLDCELRDCSGKGVDMGDGCECLVGVTGENCGMCSIVPEGQTAMCIGRGTEFWFYMLVPDEDVPLYLNGSLPEDRRTTDEPNTPIETIVPGSEPELFLDCACTPENYVAGMGHPMSRKRVAPIGGLLRGYHDHRRKQQYLFKSLLDGIRRGRGN